MQSLINTLSKFGVCRPSAKCCLPNNSKTPNQPTSPMASAATFSCCNGFSASISELHSRRLQRASFIADSGASELSSSSSGRKRAMVVRAQAINPEIRKDEDKVVDSVAVTELSKPLTAYCRCWRSGTFPLCDGSHVKHNKATGDNVGPLLLKKQ